MHISILRSTPDCENEIPAEKDRNHSHWSQDHCIFKHRIIRYIGSVLLCTCHSKLAATLAVTRNGTIIEKHPSVDDLYGRSNARKKMTGRSQVVRIVTAIPLPYRRLI